MSPQFSEGFFCTINLVFIGAGGNSGSVSKVGDYAKIWDNLKRKKALSLTPLS